ncbi:hypothetical protein Tco_0858636 [Tanacetum coccineum]|uniref:Uncharacterized protein n=1 Tax=Tanacetum coccineum TaxID=301880 RepID=A0ABQ5BDQ7_9ASTR
MSILNKSLTGKDSWIDRAREPITEEAHLEKLKYVAKGERKPTFGMPIPEAMLSLMRKGDVPTLKKKKDAVTNRPRSITFADNVLPEPDEALEYAKMVNMEETQH